MNLRADGGAGSRMGRARDVELLRRAARAPDPRTRLSAVRRRARRSRTPSTSSAKACGSRPFAADPSIVGRPSRSTVNRSPSSASRRQGSAVPPQASRSTCSCRSRCRKRSCRATGWRCAATRSCRCSGGSPRARFEQAGAGVSVGRRAPAWPIIPGHQQGSRRARRPAATGTAPADC